MKEIILRDDNERFEIAIRIKNPKHGMNMPSYKSMFRNIVQSILHTLIAIYPIQSATIEFLRNLEIAIANTNKHIGEIKDKKP